VLASSKFTLYSTTKHKLANAFNRFRLHVIGRLSSNSVFGYAPYSGISTESCAGLSKLRSSQVQLLFVCLYHFTAMLNLGVKPSQQ